MYDSNNYACTCAVLARTHSCAGISEPMNWPCRRSRKGKGPRRTSHEDFTASGSVDRERPTAPGVYTGWVGTHSPADRIISQVLGTTRLRRSATVTRKASWRRSGEFFSGKVWRAAQPMKSWRMASCVSSDHGARPPPPSNPHAATPGYGDGMHGHGRMAPGPISSTAHERPCMSRAHKDR
jgi:hypothetical protein